MAKGVSKKKLIKAGIYAGAAVASYVAGYLTCDSRRNKKKKKKDKGGLEFMDLDDELNTSWDDVPDDEKFDSTADDMDADDSEPVPSEAGAM